VIRVSRECHVQLFASDANAPVRWRLLSGNNRELGRGLISYADADTCLIALKDLQADVSELEGRVRRSKPNGWAWDVVAEGVAIAVAGHSFDRLIRCEQALARFFVAIVGAPVTDDVMFNGSRRRASVRS
jgi:hypothetical protein